MRMIKPALASLLLAAPVWACAAAGNTLDLYYVPVADFEATLPGEPVFDDGAEFDDGDGFGLKGNFDVAPQVFLTGEYQANEYEGVEGVSADIELNVFRLGAGYRFVPQGPLYMRAEYIDLELEREDESDDGSGWGAHLGAELPAGEVLSLYGEVGYVDIGDAGSGLELLGGLVFMLAPQWALFADYRYTELEDDNDDEVEIGDLRTGVRFRF